MISTESFSKEWIVRRSEELGYNNKQLLEKVIRAFALLEMLVDAGAPVIFKGGSSLLLILKDTLNRLSIDVDVICPPGVDIRGYLKNLEEHGFLSIIPVRTEHGGKDLPASHFKSFYEVVFGGKDDEESFIRLDVLYEENPYSNTRLLPIDSPFFKLDGEPLQVRVPSKEDILGDKLTAFGPNTLGIPYYKEDRSGQLRRCSLEIIKQLFDISCLFNVVEDFKDAYASFRKVSEVELGYRKMKARSTATMKMCVKAPYASLPAARSGRAVLSNSRTALCASKDICTSAITTSSRLRWMPPRQPILLRVSRMASSA